MEQQTFPPGWMAWGAGATEFQIMIAFGVILSGSTTFTKLVFCLPRCASTRLYAEDLHFRNSGLDSGETSLCYSHAARR
jgi:hypothetical protein